MRIGHGEQDAVPHVWRGFAGSWNREATISLTLATQRSGLQLTLDGQPMTAPQTITGVAEMLRGIGAPQTQTLGGVTYRFRSWSDGGAATHDIVTPTVATTYTARYQRSR